MGEMLHNAQFTVSVLTGGALVLLAYLFGSSSRTSGTQFTRLFLVWLTLEHSVKAFEVTAAAWRTFRISPESVPLDALAAGLAGRTSELAIYILLTWFLIRPTTRKSLNGGNTHA